MNHKNDDEAFFNDLHPTVYGLALIVIGLELLFGLAENGILGGLIDPSARRNALIDYAFWQQLFNLAMANGEYRLDVLITLLSYPLLHTGFIHAVVSAAIILFMGTILARLFHYMWPLGIFWIASVAGGLAYAMLSTSQAPLLGASPGYFGLIGAVGFVFLYTLHKSFDRRGQRMLSIPLVFLVVPTVMNIFLTSSQIWIADLAGAATGFIIAIFISPGGARTLGSLLGSLLGSFIGRR